MMLPDEPSAWAAASARRLAVALLASPQGASGGVLPWRG